MIAQPGAGVVPSLWRICVDRLHLLIARGRQRRWDGPTVFFGDAELPSRLKRKRRPIAGCHRRWQHRRKLQGEMGVQQLAEQRDERHDSGVWDEPALARASNGTWPSCSAPASPTVPFTLSMLQPGGWGTDLLRHRHREDPELSCRRGRDALLRLGWHPLRLRTSRMRSPPSRLRVGWITGALPAVGGLTRSYGTEVSQSL